MNTGKIKQITDYLFCANDNKNVLQAGTGSTLPCEIKSEILEVYRHQPVHSSRRPSDTPINQRNIEIIDVLPTLARDPDFLEKLNNHAKDFCKNFMDQARSSGIESALKGKPVETLVDAKKFLEFILDKHKNNQPITDKEKLAFKLLLTGMLKMDHSLDAENSSSILKTLTRHSHPDRTKQDIDLYSCILSKGRSHAKVINDVWDVEPTQKSAASPHNSYISTFSDDQLLEAIVNLRSLKEAIVNLRYPEKMKTNETILFNKIMNELQSRNPLCQEGQEGNFKENLLKLIIESNEIELLKILLNRPDFDISQVKIGNETPFIYAIQTADCPNRSAIIAALKDNDTNTLGLEGKTPLQIAIDYDQKFPRKSRRVSGYRYNEAIRTLLHCPNQCVDSKDSTGLTALCYFALFPKIDPASLNFIKQLIKLGANIDHPVPGYGTVRTLLEEKLNRLQFAEIESLAANNHESYQR